MDFKKINPKLWTFIILISIGAIIYCSWLIISEVREATKECETSFNGEYNFKILSGHFCNGRSFVKLVSCQPIKNQMQCKSVWTFEDSIGKINVSEFVE